MLLASLISSFTFLSPSIDRCAAIVFLLILFIFFLLEKKNEAGKGGKLSTQLSWDVQGYGEGLLCDMNSNETFKQA